MLTDSTGILFVVSLLAIGVMWSFLRSSKANRILKEWAAENDFQLVSGKRRTFRRGPFWITTSRGQEVFYVTVTDAQGRTRRGWVRLGGFMLGLMSDHAEVRWDE